MSWLKTAKNQDDALEGEVACKALRFELGVTEDTEVPDGHSVGGYLEPMKWLCKFRVRQLGGSKLIHNKVSLTKGNLDELSDWFRLVGAQSADEPAEVWMNSHPPQKLDMSWVPLTKGDDWQILNAHSYEEAEIYSRSQKVKNPIWVFVNDEHTPVYQDSFDYPENEEVPNIPKDFDPNNCVDSGSSFTPPRASGRTATSTTGTDDSPVMLRGGFKVPG